MFDGSSRPAGVKLNDIPLAPVIGPDRSSPFDGPDYAQVLDRLLEFLQRWSSVHLPERGQVELEERSSLDTSRGIRGHGRVHDRMMS